LKLIRRRPLVASELFAQLSGNSVAVINFCSGLPELTGGKAATQVCSGLPHLELWMSELQVSFCDGLEVNEV
jgi:hypothetical protein